MSADPATDEAAIGRGIGRMLHLDDLDRINFLRDTFLGDTPPTTAHMVQAERARLTMAMMTLLRPRKGHYPTLDDALAHVWQYPELRAEITELLDVLGERVTHLHTPADIHANVPLQVHATYAREEVMAALGPSTIDAPVLPQGGVLLARTNPDRRVLRDPRQIIEGLLPTTRYHDYAISDTLFHWESQSVTRTASPTGQRYINQRTAGTNIALFIRRSPKTPDGRTRSYFFAGLADYISHRGERPIAFTWEVATAVTRRHVRRLPGGGCLSYDRVPGAYQLSETVHGTTHELVIVHLKSAAAGRCGSSNVLKSLNICTAAGN